MVKVCYLVTSAAVKTIDEFIYDTYLTAVQRHLLVNYHNQLTLANQLQNPLV